MALRKCKDCGNEVSSRAAACPKCGAPTNSKRRPVLIGCLCLLGVPVVFLIIGAIVRPHVPSGTENTPPRTESSATPLDEVTTQVPAQSESKVTEYKTGETVKIGYTTYLVKRSFWSKRLSNNQYLDQRPNAMYLFVDLTVRNDDTKARTIPPFKLLDDAGREYDSDSRALMRDDCIGLLTDLNPDVSKRGFVVFDVPKDRTYRLQVDGGYWSAESALVELVPDEAPPARK